MPAAYTHKLSVQVLDFEDIRLLIQLARLICDFCSSSQRFACGFLQIPPRDGHPCRPANGSPCRVHGRLSLPSECALPGAQKKRGRIARPPFHWLGWLRLLEVNPCANFHLAPGVNRIGNPAKGRVTRKTQAARIRWLEVVKDVSEL